MRRGWRPGFMAACCALAVGCSAAAELQPHRTPTAPPQPSNPASDVETPRIDAAREFADGYQAFQAGDFDRAARLLARASERDDELRDYALFYLASAARDLGRDEQAAAAFARVVRLYPRSVHAARAQLELARLELKLGRPSDASKTASRLIASRPADEIEQGARMLAAEALFRMGDARGAYAQAMALREKFPRGALTAKARELAYRVIREHPDVINVSSVDYRIGEAELLLKEWEPRHALAEAEAAMRLGPSRDKLPAILWIKARALKGEPVRARRELLEYLRVAPRAAAAPSVIEALALNYWNAGENAHARKTFERLVREFPQSRLAPLAMLRIGRLHEEAREFDSARAQYQRLIARYPQSDAARDARFRAGWMLYMAGRYPEAAKEFERMAARADGASERDMFRYWRARALERSGDVASAQAVYRTLAAATDSNYYPTLAALRVPGVSASLPAAGASLPDVDAPAAVSGPAAFHLERAVRLRALGLSELEPPELRALAKYTSRDRRLRDFVLAGFVRSGAYYDLIVAATRMSSRGEIDRALAEKLRYPRGYWTLLKDAAERRSLDPYLLVALTRQESLFDPGATSRSDARGLMQLLPSTARRVAREAGVEREPLDLYQPALNVELGTAYLKNLMRQFKGDEFRAVAAYNGGERAVERWNARFSGEVDEWVENIGYRETRDYVKKVIGGRREYLLLYESNGRASATASHSPE